MRKLLAGGFTILAVLGIGISAQTTASATTQSTRWLCGADTVDVRYSEGGAPTGRIVSYGQTVEHDSGGGTWWHITSPYSGYVLGQYFC
ncbi:hypothetical protein [Amycolatopsis sp. NPDC051071]|uniref:hypothetical protein n=1 Tax=Amycolatopsis sp. NPDC051071 TaxID=3154637 RepID=UPI00343DE3A9